MLNSTLDSKTVYTQSEYTFLLMILTLFANVMVLKQCTLGLTPFASDTALTAPRPTGSGSIHGQNNAVLTTRRTLQVRLAKCTPTSQRINATPTSRSSHTQRKQENIIPPTVILYTTHAQGNSFSAQ